MEKYLNICHKKDIIEHESMTKRWIFIKYNEYLKAHFIIPTLILFTLSLNYLNNLIRKSTNNKFGLIQFICLMLYQLLMGYLMQVRLFGLMVHQPFMVI